MTKEMIELWKNQEVLEKQQRNAIDKLGKVVPKSNNFHLHIINECTY